ncbi:MAG: hypothetical protein AB1505_32430 [Candidatus Latescibacterota bacterium]
MQDLIIAGIGPHAREMADIVEQVNRAAPTWRLLGFLAPEGVGDGPSELGGYPVLLPDARRPARPQALVALQFGVTPPAGARLATLIAPSTFVARSARVGAGCVVLEDVPPDSVVVGNPARRLRGRSQTSLT